MTRNARISAAASGYKYGQGANKAFRRVPIVPAPRKQKCQYSVTQYLNTRVKIVGLNYLGRLADWPPSHDGIKHSLQDPECRRSLPIHINFSQNSLINYLYHGLKCGENTNTDNNSLTFINESCISHLRLCVSCFFGIMSLTMARCERWYPYNAERLRSALWLPPPGRRPARRLPCTSGFG